MGACFQAPCAAPEQRPMETLLCLTFVISSLSSLAHVPSYAQNYQHVGETCWHFCVDGLFRAPYNVSQGQGENKNKNKFRQQK